MEHHGAAHGDDLAHAPGKSPVLKSVASLTSGEPETAASAAACSSVMDEQAMPDHLERDRIDLLALVAVDLRLASSRQCDAHALTLSATRSMMMLP